MNFSAQALKAKPLPQGGLSGLTATLLGACFSF